MSVSTTRLDAGLTDKFEKPFQFSRLKLRGTSANPLSGIAGWKHIARKLVHSTEEVIQIRSQGVSINKLPGSNMR